METDSIRSRTLPPDSGELRSEGLRGPAVQHAPQGPSAMDEAEFVFAKAEAQRSATLVQLGALAGAIACIAMAALLQAPINRQRADLQLVLQSDIYSDLPPKYAWVSAAGGTFRGVAASILWMRADNLKQESKYYELHQLAKWICTLQPRFAHVWKFHAWNMSYNISVATHSTQERWQWVYNGIRLLRDEGIPNNERVVGLYHEIAWTYFHKVGERLDDYQLKYKRIWATTMEVLLGSPPPGLSQQEQVDYFKPVADAPANLAGLYAQQPGTRALVQQLADRGVDVEVGTRAANIFHPLELSFFKPYTSYKIESRFAGVRKTPREMDEQTTRMFAFFQAAPPADLNALLAYLRAKVLREQYKMDPSFMYAMQSRLGTDQAIPIDWRNPWAHALYWGMYGTEKGVQLKSVQQFDLINTDRIVLFSLGQIARLGDYVFRPNLERPEESFLTMRPDWRFAEAVHQTALRLGQIYAEEGEDVRNTAGESFRDYHINTLHSLVLGLYFSGYKDQAQKYFEYLAVNYPDQFTDETKDIYFNFRDFMQQQIKDMAGTQYEAIMLINSLLRDAYMELANGQHDRYAARAKDAFELYESYQKDTIEDREGRRTLPPWQQMMADALGGYITDSELPLVLRFVVWERETSSEVKRRCYDDVRQALEQMYAKSDLDIDKAFPPPPGMEEFRRNRPVETPEQLAEEAYESRRQREKEQNR